MDAAAACGVTTAALGGADEALFSRDSIAVIMLEPNNGVAVNGLCALATAAAAAAGSTNCGAMRTRFRDDVPVCCLSECT